MHTKNNLFDRVNLQKNNFLFLSLPLFFTHREASAHSHSAYPRSNECACDTDRHAGTRCIITTTNPSQALTLTTVSLLLRSFCCPHTYAMRVMTIVKVMRERMCRPFAIASLLSQQSSVRWAEKPTTTTTTSKK